MPGQASPERGTDPPPRLRMRGVSKTFGPTRALRDVSLSVAPGEVHALIGENGAGKSTLMKVLSGACAADSGSIDLDGEPFVPQNPLHARQCGIAMIYQELTLAPHLSVEENILLGSEPARLGWIRKAERRAMAHRALAELNHDSIPLSAPVHSLSIAEKQVVEIARALVHEPRVLIMDEPTSSLTQVDTENLFRVIGRLRECGVAVVYISHFLEECQRVCQRYTVLRDGRTVASGPMASADLHAIVRHMVGREISDIYPGRPHRLGAPVLRLRGVAGTTKPRSINLDLHEGEILGIAGLVGAGRTETVRTVFGLDPMSGGEIELFGASERRPAPRDSLDRGMGLLSENRKEEGLMVERSLADNLTLTRYQPVSRWGWISRRRQRKETARWMRALKVKAESPDQAVATLSGGNQQKIALGRLLHHDAKILLLDEPTRGIDVGSKAQIYRLIGDLAAEGRAIVFISSYLPELLGVCDTIGVMCRGRLSAVRPAAEWTEHGIILAAIGREDGTDVRPEEEESVHES